MRKLSMGHQPVFCFPPARAAFALAGANGLRDCRKSFPQVWFYRPIKWLNNKAHDKRPEIRKLAQEQLDMRFHPERLASDDADEFEDLLLNKDDEDEDEW